MFGSGNPNDECKMFSGRAVVLLLLLLVRIASIHICTHPHTLHVCVGVRE